MRLVARIGECSLGFEDLAGAECPPSASEYTLDLPDTFTRDPEILRTLAHGLLFDNEWTREGTVSYWFIEAKIMHGGTQDPPKILTHEDKVRLYNEKKYTFPPPPVNTTQWGMDSWIRYIDFYGKWTP